MRPYNRESDHQRDRHGDSVFPPRLGAAPSVPGRQGASAALGEARGWAGPGAAGRVGRVGRVRDSGSGTGGEAALGRRWSSGKGGKGAG